MWADFLTKERLSHSFGWSHSGVWELLLQVLKWLILRSVQESCSLVDIGATPTGKQAHPALHLTGRVPHCMVRWKQMSSSNLRATWWDDFRLALATELASLKAMNRILWCHHVTPSCSVKMVCSDLSAREACYFLINAIRPLAELHSIKWHMLAFLLRHFTFVRLEWGQSACLTSLLCT